MGRGCSPFVVPVDPADSAMADRRGRVTLGVTDVTGFGGASGVATVSGASED